MATAQKSNGKATTPGPADLADQIDTLKADLANLTRMMGEVGAARTEQAKDSVKSGIDTARQAGAAHVEQARVEAERLGQDAREFVARKPAAALGIAAGVGFLIGVLGARK